MEHVKHESQKTESPFKAKFQHDFSIEAPTVNEFFDFNDENKEESENGGADPFTLAMVAAEDGDHNMDDEHGEDQNQGYNLNGLTQANEDGRHEFGFEDFNAIDEASEGSGNMRNEMIDTERSDMFDLINLFHNREGSMGPSGLTTNNRNSVLPSEFPSTVQTGQGLGQGSSYRDWVNDARDMSTLHTRIKGRQSLSAYGQTPGAISSKKTSMAGPALIGSETEGKGTKQDKAQRKKVEFTKNAVNILAHMDLNSDAPAGKLTKSFN